MREVILDVVERLLVTLYERGRDCSLLLIDVVGAAHVAPVGLAVDAVNKCLSTFDSGLNICMSSDMQLINALAVSTDMALGYAETVFRMVVLVCCDTLIAASGLMPDLMQTLK